MKEGSAFQVWGIVKPMNDDDIYQYMDHCKGKRFGKENEEFGDGYVIIKIPTRNQVKMQNRQLDL